MASRNARLDPAFARRMIGASDLDGVPNNDEETQARADDSARKAYRMAEEKESRALPVEPSDGRGFPRPRPPFEIRVRDEHRFRPRPFVR